MIRILVVEDDVLLREMYELKLSLEGFNVSAAPNGQTGLDLALGLRPDILILDNLMPRLTGLELLEAYNSLAPGHNALVFLLSNKSDMTDINRAKQLGAHEYLIKAQFAPKDIVYKIRGHIRHRS